MLTISLKERQKPVFLFHAEICFDYDIKGSVTPLVYIVQVFKHAQVNNEAHEGTIIFITARKRSLGKGNMFTGVCLSTGGGGAWSGGCLLRRGGPPRVPGGDPPGTATAAGGTHPTGMHSC